MSQRGPLHGVHVVSLAINLPGPLAVARLRALGATVTKVEPPTGDPLQAVVPAWYAELSEGQRVMTLDLKEPGDRAVAARELSNADLLLTAQRPSALVKLGLDELTAANPHLSHVEIVGHDRTAAEQPGHDLTYQAVHGTLQPPTMPTVPVADLLGAERAVTATLLALRTAAETGAGQHERIVLEQAASDAGAAVRHGLTGAGAPLGGAIPVTGSIPAPTGMSPWPRSSRTSGRVPARASASRALTKNSNGRLCPGRRVSGKSLRSVSTFP